MFRAKNYLAQVKDLVIHWRDWRAAGYPTRSPEWVSKLFEICKGCEWYEPEGKNPFTYAGFCKPGLCGKCGCHVGPDPDNQVNALIYPTKPCPAGKFEATVLVEDDVNPNPLEP